MPPHSLRRRLGPALILLAACQPPEDPPVPAAAALPPPVAVPSQGSPTRLDVASWNVEWFGAAGNGPRDDLLQLARVRDVIRGTEADLWGIVEVADAAAWKRLVALLPGYAGVLASDPETEGGPASYHRGEQKVGLLYRTDLATVLDARVILREHDRAFAGRPPLQVRLRIARGGSAEEVAVIVLHMKAFADAPSRSRREAAGAALKGYLDARHAGRRVLVIGDWNDDVDVSIMRGAPTPYAAFAADTAYTFVTAPLSARRISSTAGYRDLIDHHLASGELAARHSAGDVMVYRLDAVLPAFASTVSDHFPVISRYAFSRP